MYIHLEIMFVKLATRLSDNPAGVGGQRYPIVRLADHPPRVLSREGKHYAVDRVLLPAVVLAAALVGRADFAALQRLARLAAKRVA